MKSYRIHILEPENFSPKALSYLKTFSEVSFGYCPEQDKKDIDVLFVRLKHNINRGFLKGFNKLSVVVSPTTGEEHLDKQYFAEKNIKLLSLKGEFEFLSTIPATAEFSWGLILSLSRKLPFAFDSVKSGNWDRDLFRGNDLKGKTLALVGFGRISKLVTKYALAFDMRVKAYDPFVRKMDKDVIECSSLTDLVRDADIVSIHASLDESTVNLIDNEVMLQMKKGVIFVNTSRGEIVDNNALVRQLQSEHIACAAVDVLPDERNTSNDTRKALINFANEHERLIITPHLGGATIESMAMTEEFMARKLNDNLLGVA